MTNNLTEWNQQSVDLVSSLVKSRISAQGKKATKGNFIDEAVKVISAKDQMMQNFLEYSGEVVSNRSFASCLDGLLPVQRRLLYQGFLDNLRPDRSFVKSSKLTADTMAELHPHGDAAIYQASVNMARLWSRVRLIEGSGNFGLTYGDDAAAMRYTYERLSVYGWSMVEDLVHGAVPMITSEDHDTVEPKFLPTRFPNLIVNGGDGISVGYTYKIPQHNPVEVMQLVEAMIKDPSLSTEEMMEIMPGPDWKTGGIVLSKDSHGNDLIKKYYETGEANIKLRAKAEFENGDIIITEMPYGVSATSVIDKIHKAITDGKISSCKGVKELSSKKLGTKIEIGVKRGFSPQDTLEDLYGLGVGLEISFPIKMNVLNHDKVLSMMSMKDVINDFIYSRYEVLKNITAQAIDKDEKSKHLLEGMSKILLDIDKAVSIIRNSDNSAKAKKSLMDNFDIDEVQADYVLSLTLRRLTKQDEVELEKKIKKLAKTIKDNKAILGSKVKQKNIILKQTQDMIDIFSKDEWTSTRFTTISGKKIEKKKRTSPSSAASLPDGHWGIDSSGFLSNTGTDISQGTAFAVFKDGSLKLFNGKGLPKKSSDPVPFAPNVDEITHAGVIGKGSYLLMLSSSGKVLKLDPSKINGQGIAGQGVAGMKFKDDDFFIGATPASDEDSLLTISDDGWKVVEVSDIPVKGKGGFGVMVHPLRKGEKQVVEFSAGKSFLVDSKKAQPTPRPKVTQRGKPSSWKSE